MSPVSYPGITASHLVPLADGTSVTFDDLLETGVNARNVSLPVVGSGMITSHASVVIAQDDQEVYGVVTEDDNITLTATGDHHVLTLHQGEEGFDLMWVPVAALIPGQTLIHNPRTDEDGAVVITAAIVARVEKVGSQRVYNFVVDSEDHAYIAGGFVHLGLAGEV